MKYVTFYTKWGYAGFVGGESGIRRVCLPMNRLDQVRAVLLNDRGAEMDEEFMPRLRAAVRGYFAGQPADFERFKVDFGVQSEFSRAILEACRAVPYGRTVTYGALAEAAGCPKAARAVGQALARNPLPLIIPCHRVVNSDGRIGGFSAAGGADMKQRMLELERSAL